MPAVSHRNLDADSYVFSSKNSMLLQKNLQANKPHNISVFIWYFSGPAKDSNPWTLLSRQIIISDNFSYLLEGRATMISWSKWH